MVLPGAFKEKMMERLGEEYPLFESVLKEGKAPVSIRNNPFKFLDIGEEGVPWEPLGRYLPERPSFTLDPLFHAGAYYVQEASSMFLGEVIRRHLDLDEGLKVLDLCAAPGGKSSHILSLLNNDSFLVSNEIVKSRFSILRDNMVKWGRSNVVFTREMPENFQALPGFFDLIVVDAPCSGEGLFRRDHKAMEQWSEENVEMCALRQTGILEDVFPALADGGVLIYSTCTYNREENESIVEKLTESGNFELLSLKGDFQGVDFNIGARFIPHKTKGEGFFIAALRKLGTTEKKKEKSRGKRRRPNKLWERVSKHNRPIYKNWLKDDSFVFYNNSKGETVAFPQHLKQSFLHILDAFPFAHPGLILGKHVGKGLNPSHDLALSLDLHPDMGRIEVSKEEALRFLAKEPQHLSNGKRGWFLVTHKALGIGWVKGLGNRENNYFPKHLKIRMRIS